jgi:hypothetical protein
MKQTTRSQVIRQKIVSNPKPSKTMPAISSWSSKLSTLRTLQYTFYPFLLV